MSDSYSSEPLILQEASYDNLDAVYEMHNEIGEEENGFTNGAFGLSRTNFETYIAHLMIDYSRGIGLKPDHVPATTFWLMCGDRPVGLSRLRHRLNDALRQAGGHIGYFIRPAERGKGYGHAILALTLEKAAHMGINHALLTCDSDNIPSRRIIEKNGGLLEREENGLCYYWITR